MLLSTLEDLKSISNIMKDSFDENYIISELLIETCKLTNSNSLLVDRTGKVLYKSNNFLEKNKSISQFLITQLANLNNPLINQNLEAFGFNLLKNNFNKYYSIIYPIAINKINIATLILYKEQTYFNDKDQIIIEYITSLISIIITYNNNKKITDFENNKQIVKSALAILSFSELEAILHLFNELNANEGLIVTSKIADKFGISRSIIVNALRKLEGAGIFETRSLGMKGTYVKIINNQFINEINKLNNN